MTSRADHEKDPAYGLKLRLGSGRRLSAQRNWLMGGGAAAALLACAAGFLLGRRTGRLKK